MCVMGSGFLPSCFGGKRKGKRGRGRAKKGDCFWHPQAAWKALYRPMVDDNQNTHIDAHYFP